MSYCVIKNFSLDGRKLSRGELFEVPRGVPQTQVQALESQLYIVKVLGGQAPVKPVAPPVTPPTKVVAKVRSVSKSKSGINNKN